MTHIVPSTFGSSGIGTPPSVSMTMMGKLLSVKICPETIKAPRQNINAIKILRIILYISNYSKLNCILFDTGRGTSGRGTKPMSRVSQSRVSRLLCKLNLLIYLTKQL